MDGNLTLDSEQLVREIRQYLAAVRAFRAAGYHLAWREDPVRTFAAEPSMGATHGSASPPSFISERGTP